MKAHKGLKPLCRCLRQILGNMIRICSSPHGSKDTESRFLQRLLQRKTSLFRVKLEIFCRSFRKKIKKPTWFIYNLHYSVDHRALCLDRAATWCYCPLGQNQTQWEALHWTKMSQKRNNDDQNYKTIHSLLFISKVILLSGLYLFLFFFWKL